MTRFRLRIEEPGWAEPYWVALPSVSSQTRYGMSITADRSKAYVMSERQAIAIRNQRRFAGEAILEEVP